MWMMTCSACVLRRWELIRGRYMLEEDLAPRARACEEPLGLCDRIDAVGAGDLSPTLIPAHHPACGRRSGTAVRSYRFSHRATFGGESR